MSTAEVLQIVGAILGAVATAISACERRVLRRLEKAGATGPGSAILLTDLHALSRWRLDRLRQAGAVLSMEPDSYYLDQAAYRSFRGRRRWRALVVAAVATVLVLALWWLS